MEKRSILCSLMKYQHTNVPKILQHMQNIVYRINPLARRS